MQGRGEKELLDIWQKVKANYLVQICPQDNSFQVHFFEKRHIDSNNNKDFCLSLHPQLPLWFFQNFFFQQNINSSSITPQKHKINLPEVHIEENNILPHFDTWYFNLRV